MQGFVAALAQESDGKHGAKVGRMRRPPPSGCGYGIE
jgi:hypothetical protein